ncbi:MAG: HD domain-containing protein [Candidatus Odinarchaeota archaeon]
MKKAHQAIKEAVEKELSCSAHDIDHVMRVYRLALRLAEGERDIDLDILIPAILLHDIARVREDRDASGKIDHAVLGAEMAGTILQSQGYPSEKIDAIKQCILNHRFRKSSENEFQTIEAKILFDADKLDVLGAVGVARAFIIAGEYNERFYSDIPVEEYVKDNLTGGKMNGKIKDVTRHSPNLEYETKFKQIIGKLYTEKAKLIAEQRLAFMDAFFTRLVKEINGEL